MKKQMGLLAGMLIMAMPAASFAGHMGAKCTEDAQTCLNHMSAKKDKGYLGLELDKAEDGTLSVKKVAEGTPAAKAGFKVGDVVVARNGIKMSDHEALMQDKDSWKVGATVTYTVLRKDVEKKVPVTLAKMPEDVYARLVGEHMIANHMSEPTAAETETKSTEADTKTAEAPKK